MKALIANRGLLNRSANLLRGKSSGAGVKLEEIPKPIISAREILVKIHATALNAIDFKFADFIAPPGSILGCDFAGVIAEVGSEITPQSWKVGDRVAGFVQGGVSPERGAFAEFVKAEEDLVWRIPDGVSDEAAATYGVAGVTAMQALHLHLNVPWAEEVAQGKVDKGGAPILIYAGSTGVGLFAIQIAKQAGCTVVATASQHSFDLVKSYGADHVYDYHSASAAKEIKRAFPTISRALDCFSEDKSTKFCAEVIQGNSDKVVTLLDSKTRVAGVKAEMIMSFQLLGREFAWLPPIGPKYAVSPTDRVALARFYKYLPTLATEMKTPPLVALSGGFDGVLEGLERLRAGKVSGCKLVVKL